MAQAITHCWRRCLWSVEADAALGDLIKGQRERVLSEIEAGTAHLYRVEGPEYGGWIAFRFEQEEGIEGHVCYVIAVAGMNARRWLADFWRLVKHNGAAGIIINAESTAHVRLYTQMGFDVELAHMRLRNEFVE